jgi:sugar-specific transcriptional regulator TrmB
MINLIVTVIGGLLVIGGFYLMYLGLIIPPNPLSFFIGLIAAVFGLILVIFFGSKVDLSREGTITTKPVVPAIIDGSTPKITPKKVVKDKKTQKLGTAVKPKEIKPKAEANVGTAPSKAIKSQSRVKDEPKFGPKAAKNETGPEELAKEPKEQPHPKRVKPVIKPVKSAEKPSAPSSGLEEDDKLKPSKGRDEQFVKNRLDRLKENYIQNAKDIESIIDERLDSFKGTLDKLKSESMEPSIIWSFEAQDVQEAMKDTISKAENKLLMMYPWVRNIDVTILKKFMDLESRIIIQEASLDDDASVELLRLLLEKDVKIRTMPHVHTVTIVADDNNGLIISTDPIYESYEVGVIYKDPKSIQEIGKMFEDAWGLSQDINLELTK